MGIVYLGDFRSEQLYLQESDLANNVYIKEYNAEYDWLDFFATSQLPHWTKESTNVVILLGFNDCVYSCTWPNFYKIENIAASYAKKIGQLQQAHSTSHFYMCSVNPVIDNFPFAEYPGGVIPANLLNNTIKSFNATVKEKLENLLATQNKRIPETETKKTIDDLYIDSYTYLENTGYFITSNFNTIDGVRYSNKISEALIGYIQSCVKPVLTVAAFESRKESPKVVIDNNDDGEITDIFWCTKTYGGYNPFDPPNSDRKFDSLPGMAAYAWGRFYEISGVEPSFPKDTKAINWFNGNMTDDGKYSDGYVRSLTPTLGAIACWKKSGTNGKLAVVERISENTITFSWSEDNPTTYEEHFKLEERINTDKAWGEAANGYTFLGFIYCPPKQLASGNKSNLCTKNSYNITKEEALPNAQYIYNYFINKGWTINAIAGMLGNMWQESKLSPCVWESPSSRGKNCVIVNSDGTHTLQESGKTFTGGYGLTQCTPATKYLMWCRSIPKPANSNFGDNNLNDTGGILPFWDIDTQLKRIEAEIEQCGKSWIEGLSQWIKKPERSCNGKAFDISFQEFTKSTESPYWLGCCFLYCYERPARVGKNKSEASHNEAMQERGGEAEYWYEQLVSNGAMPTASNDFFLKNFRVKEIQTNKASFSFLIKGSTSCSYILYKKGELITNNSKKSLEIDSAVLEKMQLCTFSVENLEPYTSYCIQITGKEQHGERTDVDTIEFMTLQNFPKAPKSISLSKTDSVDNKWKLNIEKPDGENYSYEMSLFVNGKLLESKNISEITENGNNLIKTLNLNQEFNYSYKITDMLQIGVRSYITKNSKKIYNNSGYKISNTVCGLKKPIEVYIKNN